MAVRRLHPDQPDGFAFSQANRDWADVQIAKYPPGRQASAVIPLLWRAQEQEGWVSEPAIRAVADMLDMPYIRALEVATFYTMFQLAPVGRKAHVQVCGTTPCMLRGAGELIAACKSRIAPHPHEVSANGDFSWEEVECLGACVNAPMVQVFSDTYEDLTAEGFEALLDAFARGETPTPGPQVDRRTSAPVGGLTSLTDAAAMEPAARPTGEAINQDAAHVSPSTPRARAEHSSRAKPEGRAEEEAARTPASGAGKQEPTPSRAEKLARPRGLKAARRGEADDLKRISGIGPKIEAQLHELGVYHFDQIAKWTLGNVAWVDDHLRFRGRIERDDWIGQAKSLAEAKGEGAR